ncbi:hypothetical protein RND81_08G087400 [Saponaria officinalis]|uniref:Uncharacterized protein n=1 Tax=Saponaria officinalis TaxID=3572 RepID=A0AAW1J7Q9_SAPOF
MFNAEKDGILFARFYLVLKMNYSINEEEPNRAHKPLRSELLAFSTRPEVHPGHHLSHWTSVFCMKGISFVFYLYPTLPRNHSYGLTPFFFINLVTLTFSSHLL